MPAPVLTSDEIDKAAKLLLDGKLIAFPTDTVYGVAALADDDFDSAKLRAFKGGRPDPFSLHFSNQVDAALTANPQGVLEPQALSRLTPRGVTVIVAHEKTGKGLGCRVVQHDVGSAFLSAVGKPVVATSANERGQLPLRDPEKIADLPGVDAVLSGGFLPERPASTVVRMLPSGLEILREGAVEKSELAKLFTTAIEFVCLGNLNRSAFAHWFSQGVQDWWGSRIANYLPAFRIRSSGLIASPRAVPPPEMIATARKYSIDMSRHTPERFDPARASSADLAVAMGDDVFETVKSANPHAICWNIADPMGGPLAGYEQTALEARRTWLAVLARMPYIREGDAALEAEFEKVFSGTGESP